MQSLSFFLPFSHDNPPDKKSRDPEHTSAGPACAGGVGYSTIQRQPVWMAELA
jgi:hypothetical protein